MTMQQPVGCCIVSPSRKQVWKTSGMCGKWQLWKCSPSRSLYTSRMLNRTRHSIKLAALCQLLIIYKIAELKALFVHSIMITYRCMSNCLGSRCTQHYIDRQSCPWCSCRLDRSYPNFSNTRQHLKTSRSNAMLWLELGLDRSYPNFSNTRQHLKMSRSNAMLW